MGKSIFLVGYMGSGKSTIGKKLANKLNYDFLDTDQTIEDITDKSVSQIFNDEGEAAFRQLERSLIISMSGRKNMVVSTGGGAPCFFDNMAMMNKSGYTVYIKLHPDSLAKRIIASHTERPLLKRIPIDDLPAYISYHLKEREPFYSKARITIKGESLKIDDLLLELKKLL